MARLKKPANTTIKDVADLAGVSLMTVSRTLRHPDKVAEKTRTSVMDAVVKLNYIPDLSAGSLSSRKSNMIAVILPSLSFEGHLKTVDGLSRELRKRGFHILLGDNFYSDEEEMNLLRVILGRRPAGIVMINSAHSEEGRTMLSRSGVPVVETWDLPSEPIDSVVGFSHAKVGFDLTEHLIGAGYKNVAYLSGPQGADPRGDERRKGFQKAMKKHDLSSQRQVTVSENYLDMSAGKIGLEQVKEQYPDANGLICLTDRVAMGALMECRRQNIQVPDELAITGHGDFDFSEHLVPSLTTTRIDAEDIGYRTAQILLKRIANTRMTSSERNINVDVEILPRESTA